MNVKRPRGERGRVCIHVAATGRGMWVTSAGSSGACRVGPPHPRASGAFGREPGRGGPWSPGREGGLAGDRNAPVVSGGVWI